MTTLLIRDWWAWWWTIPDLDPLRLPGGALTRGNPLIACRLLHTDVDPGADWRTVVGVISEAVIRSAGRLTATAAGVATVQVAADVGDAERRLCQTWLGDDAMPVTGEPNRRSLVDGHRRLQAARATTGAPLPVRSLALSRVPAAIRGQGGPVLCEAISDELDWLLDWWRTAPQELTRVNHHHLLALTDARDLLGAPDSRPGSSLPGRADHRRVAITNRR